MLCMLQWNNNYCINRLFCNQSKNCSYCTHLCVFRPLSVCGPFPQTLVGRLVSLLLTNQSPLWQFHLHAANIRFNLYWKKDTARINNYNIFIPLHPLNLVFMPQRYILFLRIQFVRKTSYKSKFRVSPSMFCRFNNQTVKTGS